jgi:hypothetical protein
MHGVGIRHAKAGGIMVEGGRRLVGGRAAALICFGLLAAYMVHDACF